MNSKLDRLEARAAKVPPPARDRRALTPAQQAHYALLLDRESVPATLADFSLADLEALLAAMGRGTPDLWR